MNTRIHPIEAHERTLGDVFSDAYAFEIPPYQRPYAWEIEQTQELLKDLFQALDDPERTHGAYFLGSVVLIKTPGSPQAKIVDGQQRLTTLTILLSILRDLTTDVAIRIRRANYVLQTADPDRGTEQRCRLLLRDEDRSFFESRIQIPGATGVLPDPTTLKGSQRRIADNARFLREQLESQSEDRRNSLFAFIIQHCYLVVVAVSTADDARRIFTVLNARGMDLTPTDILKADLLERAGAKAEDSLARRWQSIESALGREKMVELFGHIRMIFARDKARTALESGFARDVKSFTGDPQKFVSEILDPIADAALVLADTQRVKTHYGADAARLVRSLERIDNKDWMPAALLRIWKAKPEEKQAVADFLTRLERLAYYLFVCRSGINERIARFGGVMDQFDKQGAGDLMVGGIDLDSNEQKRFLEALKGPLYTVTRVCKPVLLRLDEALSSGGASYEPVSIEHVLPQTVDPGSEWEALFPDKTERDEWTHRLANLVFLTKRVNSRASNWAFDKKKTEYFTSQDGVAPFPLTLGVLRAEKWTPQHLSERQQYLLTRLAKVWNLEQGTTANAGIMESP